MASLIQIPSEDGAKYYDLASRACRAKKQELGYASSERNALSQICNTVWHTRTSAAMPAPSRKDRAERFLFPVRAGQSRYRLAPERQMNRDQGLPPA
ncbi:MAG TPA: hypothetical protein VF418_11755 [Sphingomonadaceae bacterium]